LKVVRYNRVLPKTNNESDTGNCEYKWGLHSLEEHFVDLSPESLGLVVSVTGVRKSDGGHF